MRTQAPDFWSDAKNAEKIMKQVRELKTWIEGCEEVERAVGDLGQRWTRSMQRPWKRWKAWN